MAQTSRFWDGTTTGDATAAPYDAATKFSGVARSISGAGGVATNLSAVFRGELNQLAATGASSPVQIDTGRAITYGTWFEQDAAVTVAIPTPAASTRIDRIVLRKDWTLQTVRPTRIAGVEGGGAPALVQIAGTTWDEPLVQVSITTGGVITLTDQRQFIGSNSMTNIASFGVGDLLYADTTTTLARLAIGAANRVLTSTGTVPQWVTALSGLTGVSIASGNLVFAGTSQGIVPSATSLVFRDSANSVTNITITDAGNVTLNRGILSVNGITSAVASSTATGGARGAAAGIATNMLVVQDTTALAAGVGGVIVFEGIYTGTTKTAFAQVAGNKTNATDGNFDGTLVLSTRVNGGNMTDQVSVTPAGNVLPAGNGVRSLGAAGQAWLDVYATRGAFNGSTSDIKRNWTPLEGIEAMQVLRQTLFGKYQYVPMGMPDEDGNISDPASEWWHVGVLADKPEQTHELFTFGDRKHVNPQTTASIVGAALKYTDNYITKLENEIEELRQLVRA